MKKTTENYPARFSILYATVAVTIIVTYLFSPFYGNGTLQDILIIGIAGLFALAGYIRGILLSRKDTGEKSPIAKERNAKKLMLMLIIMSLIALVVLLFNSTYRLDISYPDHETKVLCKKTLYHGTTTEIEIDWGMELRTTEWEAKGYTLRLHYHVDKRTVYTGHLTIVTPEGYILDKPLAQGVSEKPTYNIKGPGIDTLSRAEKILLYERSFEMTYKILTLTN